MNENAIHGAPKKIENGDLQEREVMGDWGWERLRKGELGKKVEGQGGHVAGDFCGVPGVSPPRDGPSRQHAPT